MGRTGGVSAKLYQRPDLAYEALLTFDGDDFARLSLFRVWERPVPDSLLHAYYGPALFLGSRDLATGPESELGVGGKIGFNFYAERFEVFLHVTPTLWMHPRLAPHVGGGVGLRYDL